MAAKAGTPFAASYHYAYNQPTTLTDPSGACPWCVIIVVVGIASLIGGAAAQERGENVPMGIVNGGAAAASIFIPGGPAIGVVVKTGLGVTGKGIAAASKIAASSVKPKLATQSAASQALAKNTAWAKANSKPAHLPANTDEVACIKPGATTAGTQGSKSTQGIYEFFDEQKQMTYVGRSFDIPRCLAEHVRSGKLKDVKAAKVSEGNGGLRELRTAEQLRINYLGDIGRLANVRNEIAKNKWAQFGITE